MGSVPIKNLDVLSPQVRNEGFWEFLKSQLITSKNLPRRVLTDSTGWRYAWVGRQKSRVTFHQGLIGCFILGAETRKEGTTVFSYAVSAFVPGYSVRHKASQGHFSQKCALFINPVRFCFCACHRFDLFYQKNSENNGLLWCKFQGRKMAKHVYPRGHRQKWIGPGRIPRISHTWYSEIGRERSCPK